MDDAREKAKHKVRLRFGLGYAEPTDEHFNNILKEVKDLRSQGLSSDQIDPKLEEIVQRCCPTFQTSQYPAQDPGVLIQALISLLEEQGV
ncbi:MAG: hypothetical protein ACE5JK_01965 [Candidatus Omnitrophota bacterium]